VKPGWTREIMRKILHVHNIYLDSPLEYLSWEKREARNKQIENTFLQTIDLALQEKVQFCLITGDLFANNYPCPRVINLVNDQLIRLLSASTEVCIAPSLKELETKEQTIYFKLISDPKLHLFLNSNWDKFNWLKQLTQRTGYPADLETTAWGKNEYGFLHILEGEGKKNRVEKRQLAQKLMKQLILNCSEYGDLEELKSRIKTESHSDLLLQVVLKEQAWEEIDFEAVAEELEDHFFYLNIIDKTVKCYQRDESKITVKNTFLSIMQKKIKEGVGRKKELELALALGMQALVGGEN